MAGVDDRGGYSLLIVDDEEIIRRGLTEFTDWRALGFSVAASFEDGRDAIEFLVDNRVDAILTDIKMAEVSGIEVAEYVRLHCPSTKVVLLSGYREFEDAKAAIELGVRHYLLKPVDITMLHSVFRELAGLLDAERRSSERARSQDLYQEEIASVFQEHFFFELLAGTERDTDRIVDQFKYTRLPVDPESAPCTLLHVELCGPEQVDRARARDVRETVRSSACRYLASRVPGLTCCPVTVSDADIILICFAQEPVEEGSADGLDAAAIGRELEGFLSREADGATVRSAVSCESFLAISRHGIRTLLGSDTDRPLRSSSEQSVFDRKSTRLWLERLLSLPLFRRWAAGGRRGTRAVRGDLGIPGGGNAENSGGAPRGTDDQAGRHGR